MTKSTIEISLAFLTIYYFLLQLFEVLCNLPKIAPLPFVPSSSKMKPPNLLDCYNLSFKGNSSWSKFAEVLPIG